MEKQKEKLPLKQRGITLIALVITIIVLLILAGISIGMLTGESGLIKQSQNAKTQTEIAEEKEVLDTAIVKAMGKDKYGNIEKIYLEKELEDYNVIIMPLGENFTAEFESGRKYIIKQDGSVIPKEGVLAEDIANATDKSQFYGAIVRGYELPSGTTTDVGWKIFYADNSNIYLIADNYVERANLPNSRTEAGELTTNKPNDGASSFPRAAYFSNILPDYNTGSARITDAKLKALNNDYFTKGYTSTNNNMKAVAYMMDTTAWNSKFKDVNNKAEYVIGGPSVELLFKSYNDKYRKSYESQATDKTGYRIRKTSSDSWTAYCDMLTNNDSLYVIPNTQDAGSYWLTSPSASYEFYVYKVWMDGGVDGKRSTYDNSGFRPLVSLKSDIQLQKNADGTYTIL